MGSSAATSPTAVCPEAEDADERYAMKKKKDRGLAIENRLVQILRRLQPVDRVEPAYRS